MSRLKAIYPALAISAALLTGCTIPTLPAPAPTAVMPTIATQLHTHYWTLQQAFDAQQRAEQHWFLPSTPTQAARTVELNFEDHQRVHVTRLCNSMNGAYQAQGSNLHITSLVSTMMACPESNVMQLEHQVGVRLPQASSWSVQGDTLEIHFAEGQRWLLHGTPKYSVLYGHPERIFLEISPQTSTCHMPTIRDAQCLQVRTIEYDAQGIKKQVGVWEHFYANIEGYTHQEGTRSVVRLNRYTRPDAPTDASRYIYVHDMTVESSRAP